LSRSEKVCLVVFVDLADEFHVWMGLDHRANLGLPIDLVDTIHLGRDLERHSASHGDLDRVVRPFLRRNPAEEREIAAGRAWPERKQGARNAMMHRADPIRVAQITVLSARDRNQRELPKDRIKRGKVRQVKSAMLSGQSTVRDVADQWGVKDIDMKMQDVEVI